MTPRSGNEDFNRSAEGRGMDIAQERDGDVVILKLVGRLDSNTAKSAEDGLAGVLSGGATPRVVIDMSQLAYISSAGLRVLLAAAKKAKQGGGKLALFGLLANVREVFSISGFDTIFSILPGRSAALAAVRE
jgi:anti-sigma B factor antagonist